MIRMWMIWVGETSFEMVLKIERGTYRPDRDNPDQPEPDGPPELPPWHGKRDRIRKRATELWDQLAPDATERGILCRRWSEAFANMCMEQAKYEEFTVLALRRVREVESLERYQRLAKAALENVTRLQAKFGMTASDNTGVMKIKKPATGGSDRRKRFFGASGNEKMDSQATPCGAQTATSCDTLRLKPGGGSCGMANERRRRLTR